MPGGGEQEELLGPPGTATVLWGWEEEPLHCLDRAVATPSSDLNYDAGWIPTRRCHA